MEQIYIDYVYKLFEFLHSHPELGMEEHEKEDRTPDNDRSQSPQV